LDFVELWSSYWPKWTEKTWLEFLFFTAVFLFIVHGYGKWKEWSPLQHIAAMLLVIYVMLVFSSTVFTRLVQPTRQYQLGLFWSYRWGMDVFGKRAILQENVMNIFMLMPIGFFLPVLICPEKEDCGKKVIITGFLTSFLIEFLQLLFRRGLFEFDDMFHNTLGVAIGYAMIWTLKKLTEKKN
jgi:glycopeptide antibiotics resistance protein